jgi:hypothetical protein
VTLVRKDGTVLARRAIAEIAPGHLNHAGVDVRLSPATAPGPLDARLLVEADGRKLADANVTIQVERWGRVGARVASTTASTEGVTQNLVVSYEGNVPTVLHPLLLGLPDEAWADFDVAALQMKPGEKRDLRVQIQAAPETQRALYSLRAAFVDEETFGTDATIGNDSVLLLLDLRRQHVELQNVQRLAPGEGVVTAGDSVTYVATVINAGTVVAKSVPVELYVDGVLVAQEMAEDVRPAKTLDVRLHWKTVSGKHAILVAVDPHDLAGHGEDAYVETLEVKGHAMGDARHLMPGPPLSIVLLTLALIALRFSWRTIGTERGRKR